MSVEEPGMRDRTRRIRGKVEPRFLRRFDEDEDVKTGFLFLTKLMLLCSSTHPLVHIGLPFPPSVSFFLSRSLALCLAYSEWSKTLTITRRLSAIVAVILRLWP